MHRVELPGTTLYYKACARLEPVLLCATNFARCTSQYYSVLQSLHKARPPYYFVLQSLHKHFPVLLCTTNLAQTKHVPVLLCTTKLAQSTSQYYFVLQSLHKTRSSTTLYYKACTNYFPVLMSTTKACKKYFRVLLCTTKFAQKTFQYYFALQSLHKPLPSTTVYYKACAKHVPVLLCTAQLVQTTSQ